MRRLTMRLLRVAALAAVLVGLSGCTSYRILRFEDHPTMKTTQLQLMKVINYGLAASSEHQFWLCKDEGDRLVCKRRCGLGTDLECPATATATGEITTNVR